MPSATSWTRASATPDVAGAGTAGTLLPLLLRPRFVRRVWGGGALPALMGEEALDAAAGEDPVGEAWLADGASVVALGPLAGATVADLADRHGAELLGTLTVDRYGPRMALLVKLLDAAEDLSVQVHPDDAYALAREADTGHLGKTEAWYVLRAAPGAAVLRGFTRDVSRDEVRAAAEDGTLPALMRRVPVRPGDVVVNPAGTVHAVGAGLLLYEVQQSSDLTYRLFDYGRVDASGRPRELHLDKGLDVAHLSAAPAELPRPPEAEPGRWRRLVARPEFVLDAVLVRPGAGAAGATTPASCHVLTVAEGTARLRAHGQVLELPTGATALLPAALGAYELSGDGEVLRAAVE